MKTPKIRQKLPLSISSFEELRLDGYLYVDKTEQIHQLFLQGKNFFLARPRRFGKSLLLSTIRALFEGKKDLFANLWIENNWKWESHPVISFDFSALKYQSAESFSLSLAVKIQSLAESYGISLKDSRDECALYSELIDRLKIKNKVVLLIDEYDAPLIGQLDSPEVLQSIRKVMINFFGTIKSLNEHMQFVLLTGVSKFSRVSVFSGLNNLEDISESNIAATILGYTHEEIERYFSLQMEFLASQTQITLTEVRQKLKTWYDGYRFSLYQESHIYNPYSVMACFKNNIFDNHWFNSATPHFLLQLIKKYPLTLLDAQHNFQIDQSALSSFEPENLPLFVLLMQTGYLTITKYLPDQRIVELGYPNQEVKESFERHLLSLLSSTTLEQVAPISLKLKQAILLQDWLALKEIIKTLFAQLPYTLRDIKEKHFHALLQIALNLAGFDVQSELLTDRGRIDLIVIDHRTAFIIELKLNATSTAAIEQIFASKYYERYTQSYEKIIAVGINFNITNTICDIEIEGRNIL